MGWTDEEPVPAINITWDGDTEGRESVFENKFFKILDNDIPDSVIEGGNVELIYGENVLSGDAFIDSSPFPTITSFGFHNESAAGGAFNNQIIVIHENTIIEEMELSKGVYFNKETSGVYISRLHKEASTVETVHQIDEKYIPSSGGATVIEFVVDEQGSVNCEYTPTQVLALMRTAPVVCVLDATVIGFPAAMPAVPFFCVDTTTEDQNNILSLYVVIDAVLKSVLKGEFVANNWEFGL